MNKGALALISTYEGDSSDDDVPGPRVSTKRVHKDDDEEGHSKIFKRLPLPDSLFDKYITAHDHIDTPALHDGRIRTFLHQRGNWASFVYIPFEEDEGIKKLITSIISSVPNIKIKVSQDFHISLTRTVILKHHWINSFVDSVRKNVVITKRFMILFDGLEVYCNEERTRTFIGLQIKTGYDSLFNLVKLLDKCLEDFNLPTFYKDPSFHMSLVWCVGDFEQELSLMLPQLNRLLQELMEEYPQENWCIYVQYLLCKIGNKYFQFHLT